MDTEEEPASSPKHKTATIECKLCCEEKPLLEFTKIEPCNHQVCTACITRYCAHGIAEIEVHNEFWACPWGDGWFKPIIDEDAWRNDAKRLSFWDKMMVKLTVPEKDREMEMMAHVEKWRRCPRCRFYVQKINGCSHIFCRCGKSFCYNCGRSFRLCYCKFIKIFKFSGRWRKNNGARW